MSQQPDPYELEGVTRRASKPLPLMALFFALLSLLLGAIMLTPVPEKVRRKLGFSKPVKASAPAPAPKPEIIVKEKIVEKVVRIRPPYYDVKKGVEVAKTTMGFDFKSGVAEKPGRLASMEREDDGTYEVAYTVSANRPEAAKHFDEVVAVNPELPKILPGLEKLMGSPKVSPFFANLYDNKTERLQSNLKRMDRLLTKHNYYDCQTMLELEHPESKRKVFLLQGDMDVVSDGSDGDRLATMPDKIVNSPYYQPFTSFGWPKTGTTENPMIAGWRKMLATAKANGDSSEVKRLEAGIKDLQKRSFLIADYDPFVVMPVYLVQDRDSPYGPNVGDYVLVIYGKDVYPTIVGDAGPSFKVGEASLRMAKQINSRSSAYNRPVSDVSVTYVVFPRSSGKWKVPDYNEWRNECLKLVDEIGGLGEGYELFNWQSTFPSAVVEEVVPPVEGVEEVAEEPN